MHLVMFYSEVIFTELIQWSAHSEVTRYAIVYKYIKTNASWNAGSFLMVVHTHPHKIETTGLRPTHLPFQWERIPIQHLLYIEDVISIFSKKL